MQSVMFTCLNVDIVFFTVCILSELESEQLWFLKRGCNRGRFLFVICGQFDWLSHTLLNISVHLLLKSKKCKSKKTYDPQ